MATVREDTQAAIAELKGKSDQAEHLERPRGAASGDEREYKRRLNMLGTVINAEPNPQRRETLLDALDGVVEAVADWTDGLEDERASHDEAIVKLRDRNNALEYSSGEAAERRHKEKLAIFEAGLKRKRVLKHADGRTSTLESE